MFQKEAISEGVEWIKSGLLTGTWYILKSAIRLGMFQKEAINEGIEWI